MCTVSWIHTDDGYRLLFNRDEKLTRRPGIPPELREQREVKFIAPLDGDHGGSWIAVNQFGLTLCLLNLYESAPEGEGYQFISRGRLIIDLIDSIDWSGIERRLPAKRLADFQPFTMVALQPERAATVFQWNGIELTKRRDGESSMPLTSSSVDTLSVMNRRREEFERLRNHEGELSIAMLCRYHRRHDPVSGAHSVCLHREDAATVSFSSVRVNNGSIEFKYLPDSPCRQRRGAVRTVRLDRVTAP